MLVGIVLGGIAVLRGQMNAGYFIFFLLQAQKAGSQFKRLSRVNQLREQANGAGARIFDLLDVVSDIRDAPHAAPLPPARGHITFEHVSFHYDTGEEVLRDLHFEVVPGEVIALVGPSGAGKTTLVNLLPRFYDPTEGRILLDGVNLREVTLVSLRGQVGIVPQETVLFSGTIADNIRYGKLDAPDEEVIEAARAANAVEFIERLPGGFGTSVGERGARLSGGQRQRIAIARALLKDPRILILDEATSSLDTESEHLVQQALERLMQNRTTFVIAHRLSTIQHAVRILVLDGGRVVEIGSHAQLLARRGLYRRLYEMQFRPASATGATRR
jgi:subfamily B ATP-binding cassette protein MsbA